MHNGFGFALAGRLSDLCRCRGRRRRRTSTPLSARAAARDIVVLGEVHDNPIHHANQAAIVAALQPDALVFEMIPQTREEEVNALREEGADRLALAEALDWAAKRMAGLRLLRRDPRGRAVGAHLWRRPASTWRCVGP